MSVERISSPVIITGQGQSFSAVEINGDGFEVVNAAEERDSTGQTYQAGSQSIISVRSDTGSTINASYIKTGVIDANLMRAGLIQTVPSWNTKWYGAPEDHAAVQMGFTGGSIAATAVSTGSGTVSLTLPGGHGLTTGDYVRVSGLYFTTGTLLGGVGLNLPTNGPLDYASATVATNTLTYSKADITSGLTASTASIVYVGKALAISTISRVLDDPDNPAELSTVTVTTGAAHGFSVGDYIELTGTIQTMDGVAYVTTVPTSTTFTFKQRFGDDVTFDGTSTGISLPTLGAPVAIKVLKSYTQNADGSIHITSGTVDSTLIVGEIAATEITIGSGEGVVRVGSYPDAISPTFQGIWAGSANPSTAEFSANTSGAVTASNLTVTGGSITIGDFSLSTGGQLTDDLVLQQTRITNDVGVELLDTQSDGGNSYALGPSLNRAIETGIINGDFGSTPPTVGSAINNSTNRLPYFSVESTAGTTITVKAVADATAASGYVLRFTIPTSANVGDVCRVYRYVAVPGSAARTWTNQPRAAWRNATGTTKTQASVAIRTQYYRNDSTTATGTAGNNEQTFSTIAGATYAYETQANPNVTGAIPEDAAYLRIAAGVVVNVAPTSELTVDLTEIRYDRGLIQLLLADQVDPSAYGYGVIYLNSGTMWIRANELGASGTNPTITLSASSGNINLDSTGTGVVMANGSEVALKSNLTGTTFDLTGDVSMTAAALTVGGANSYSVAVADDSHNHSASTVGVLTLGTDTNGNYVAGVTSANSLISVSGGAGEGTTVTLTADTTPTFTSVTTTTLSVSGAATFTDDVTLGNESGDVIKATSLYNTSTITNSQDVRIFFGTTSGNNIQWRIFRDSSSLRYKTNVVNITDSDNILDVVPITYHDKVQFEEMGEESPRQYGFLAEEMAENVDGQSYVVYNEDGTPEAIQYSRLVVPLHSAMRKLRSRIDELESRLAELETGA
jgi:hypothetical protein